MSRAKTLLLLQLLCVARSISAAETNAIRKTKWKIIGPIARLQTEEADGKVTVWYTSQPDTTKMYLRAYTSTSLDGTVQCGGERRTKGKRNDYIRTNDSMAANMFHDLALIYEQQQPLPEASTHAPARPRASTHKAKPSVKWQEANTVVTFERAEGEKLITFVQHDFCC